MMRPRPWLLSVLLAMPLGVAEASTITLDFDSVALAPGSCTSGLGYLGSFGITFVPVTAGAAPQICNVAGSTVTPVSGSNTFHVDPAVTNSNLSYDLLFSVPLTQLTFTRAGVAPFTSMPAWNAQVFDASNNLLGAVSQPFTFPGTAAMTFTFNGPGIVKFSVQMFNSAGATYNHPPFDDIVLTAPDQTAVPEPASLTLLGMGLAAVAIRRRFRRTR